MLKFIDISNWQGGMNLDAVLTSIDGVVCKATEGTGYVDPYCDGFVQTAIAAGKSWGFYHFAGDGDASDEARFFMDNCEGYFGHGIPVLDWEGNQSVAWVNEFVNAVHSEKGVRPIIYANPWRFNQGGVDSDCARWVASYPEVVSPTFEQASVWEAPYADGNVVAWQFCSDGRIDGYAGNLDLDLFYGNADQWRAYAVGNNSVGGNERDGIADSDSPGGTDSGGAARLGVLENDEYRITVERK